MCSRQNLSAKHESKGEWSEVYALFKLLADGNLRAGEADLNQAKNLLFPIIKILRDESQHTYEFSYDSDLVLILAKDKEVRIPLAKFQTMAIKLLAEIKVQKSRTFAVPEIENFLHSFHCTSLKAKSSVKSDIRIVIHDERTGANPELGFSIKSQLGSASTLLNAGITTNFIYRINEPRLNEQEIAEINSISGQGKIKNRLSAIKEKSAGLEFIQTENPIFESNLALIDSRLPEILSEMIVEYFSSEFSKTADLVHQLNEKKPLGFNCQHSHPFYEYKLKRFLTEVALGMVPSKVWGGKLDATGGYLVVKRDGEVLCYHIYNRNEFEDYLIANTKLDSSSTDRHGYGTLYSENQQLLFKLNLQIRFIK